MVTPTSSTSDYVTDHLPLETVAAYLDRQLSGLELDTAEAHLASCNLCRAEIVDLTKVLRQRRRPRLLYVGGVSAAAAAVLLFAAGTWEAARSPAETHRGAITDARVAVQLMSPTTHSDARTTWRWGPVSGADRYELTVFDADGRIVWDTTTTQSVVKAPAAGRLEIGRKYFWRVRARIDWDRWVSSDFAEFTLRAVP